MIITLYIKLSIIILLIAIISDSLEIFFNRIYYYDDGLISSKYFRLKKRLHNNKSKEKIFNIFFKYKSFMVILTVRFLFSLFLIFYLFFYENQKLDVITFIIAILFLIELYIRIRNKVGLTAAENLLVFVLFVLFVSVGTKNTNFIHYISFYAIISYFLTGYNKMLSLKWRKGTAITIVLSTEVFGNVFLLNFFKNNKILLPYFGWGIILFQLLFFASFIHPTVMIFFICLGFLFHFSLAIIMRLYNFLLIYLSIYPILYYSSIEFHNLLTSLM